AAVEVLEDDVDRGLDLDLTAGGRVAEDARGRREQEAHLESKVLDRRPADDEILHEGRGARGAVGPVPDAGRRAALAHLRVVRLDEEAERLVRGTRNLDASAAQEEVTVQRLLDRSFEGALVTGLEERIHVEVDVVAASRHPDRRRGEGHEQGGEAQRETNAIHGVPFAASRRGDSVNSQASTATHLSPTRPWLQHDVVNSRLRIRQSGLCEAHQTTLHGRASSQSEQTKANSQRLDTRSRECSSLRPSSEVPHHRTTLQPTRGSEAKEELMGQRFTRRQMIKAAGTATAAGLLLPRKGRAAKKTLKILQWNHFVPGYDKWF